MEALWAHNQEVRGSNPGRALLFRMDLQKIDAFRDHLLSIKEKLSSKTNIIRQFFQLQFAMHSNHDVSKI